MLKKINVMSAIAACVLGLQGMSPAFADAAAKSAVSAGDNIKVSLNKSDAKTLMQVNGMSAYKAHAIIAYRNKNGAFKSTAELEKVNGFKRMKPDAVKAITDHLTID